MVIADRYDHTALLERANEAFVVISASDAHLDLARWAGRVAQRTAAGLTVVVRMPPRWPVHLSALAPVSLSELAVRTEEDVCAEVYLALVPALDPLDIRWRMEPVLHTTRQTNALLRAASVPVVLVPAPAVPAQWGGAERLSRMRLARLRRNLRAPVLMVDPHNGVLPL